MSCTCRTRMESRTREPSRDMLRSLDPGKAHGFFAEWLSHGVERIQEEVMDAPRG